MSVQGERLRRGWSQAELSARSGVPRATISAVENGRVVPSVDAALALARALETSVELLFAPGGVDAWAAPPSDRFFVGRVGGRTVGYPLEPLLAGPTAPDGMLEDGRATFDPAPLDRTLIIATCDPAVTILRDALHGRGVRLIALARSSKEALDLLDAGLVHAAGVHFATRETPHANAAAARGQTLIHCASWDVGLAHQLGERTTVGDLIRPDTALVNRPVGSGARACLDRVLDAAPAARRPRDLGRIARDHRAVADIVASGFAEAGVSIRLAAAERRLGFLSLETALYDLVLAPDLADDPRGQISIEVLRSARFLRELGTLPGIDSGRGGEIHREA